MNPTFPSSASSGAVCIKVRNPPQDFAFLLGLIPDAHDGLSTGF
jgi:hypothetical protein